jgi:spermidine synthase
MPWFLFLFCVSGFCGVLYELVWLRLSMAQYGVTSALVSIVLSSFMGGLGLGSWISGQYLRKHGNDLQQPLRWYAITELLIGASAILVPFELKLGGHILQTAGISSSSAYYFASGTLVALTIVPWCACMGATIPIAMQAIRKGIAHEASRSFSYLYLSNVVGAIGGATLPLLLIELNGFRGTLQIAALLNGMLALAAFALTLKTPAKETDARPVAEPEPITGAVKGQRSALLLLFTGGLTSMGIEVVWIRQFTPFLGTVVYAFAAILALYLIATFVGSQVYRLWSRKYRQENSLIWLIIGFAALLSLIAANPETGMFSLWRLMLGIMPFSALLGFVTPMLVDRWSGGDPDRAGKAYAVNVVGCIVGPLVAGFVLLPHISERWALYAFAAPWMLIGIIPGFVRERKRPIWQSAVDFALVAASIGAVFVTKGFEDIFPQRWVLRDNTATVVATGEGTRKALYVNGINMTVITNITKYMAHMPLAFLDRPPRKALVICFGMGTTFRSLLSWKIDATAVDLVPSVPKAFPYYHSDGPQLVKLPNAHIVVDDGRRFLERTKEQFDIVTIDPPPPISAAGSSLLYSRDFYTVLKKRLAPDGIMQQWLPTGDFTVQSAVVRALKDSFRYVRGFRSAGGMGFHFLASDHELPRLRAEELTARMPASALADFVEWGPASDPKLQFDLVLSKEISLEKTMELAPQAPVLSDDRPVNEYYLIRHHGDVGDFN